jgi:hypothetical protein
MLDQDRLRKAFHTAEQVRDAFGVAEDGVYREFMAFTDRATGFSIKRPYPPDIPFKPPVKKDGSPDTFAIIRVLYNPANIAAERLDLHKVPIWIGIGKHSKYEYTHFGYNFEDKDCPTKESLARSLSTPQPVTLEFPEDFFFDHSTSQFLDKTGQPMAGLEVLEKVFAQHCDTTRAVGPQIFRRHSRVGFVCGSLTKFLEAALWLCFRKRLDYTRGSLWPDIVLLKAPSLKIFGYKTTKNVILTYASLILVTYTIVSGFGLSKNAFLAPIWKYLTSLWKHPFLALCASLVTLPLLEYGGPQVIRLLANPLKRIQLWSNKHKM